jgi:outer membrane protein assembly factor BamB
MAALARHQQRRQEHRNGLLDQWPAGGPPLVWQVEGFGTGYGSVSVSGGKLFLMGRRDGTEYLTAVNAKDGTTMWSTPVGPGTRERGPNCTPTVDGDLVYGLTIEGDLLCAETAAGREVWRKNYPRDFAGRMMSGWGYSESPLIDGDKLICTPGGPNAMMAALNKKTGAVLWTTSMPSGGRRGGDGAGYSSPVLSQAAGVKQYVQLIGRGVIGVDAGSGKLLWTYDRIANGTANIPTPIVSGDFVFCSSGYGDGGTALLQLSRAVGGIAVREVYYKSADELQNHHGGMIQIGDYVYMGNKHNQGFPVCVNMKTGEFAWQPGRGPGSGSAAIVYADGDLYFRYQNGVMALIEATPQRYNLKGEFTIASRRGESWPHPVISDGKLYLRDQEVLLCYDVRQN